MTLHATTILCVPSTIRYRRYGWWASCIDCGWKGTFFDRTDAERYSAGHVARAAAEGVR